MSTVKTNNVQLGQSVTATNNFTWYQPASPDGTVRLGNGNSGSVTDLITVGSTGNLTFANSVTLTAASTKTLTLNGGAGSNGLVLDASNNVGIGTTPGYKLEVNSGSAAYSSKIRSTTTYSLVTIEDATTTVGAGPYLGALANNLVFGRAGVAEYMRLDSSGNLGLGVTPSTSWESARRVFQVGGAGALWASTSGAGTLFLSNNTYYDGTNFRYINTSGASYIAQQTDGSFTFNRASSGTAGNAITFNQAMTLDASGNLLVGNTAFANGGKMLSYATSAFSNNTYNPLELGSAGGATVNHQVQKTTVSTSQTVILNTNLYASLVVVFGSDGTNRFIDLVLFGLGTATVNVISSLSASGTPAARTYAQTSSAYRLTMASGTYTVQAYAMSMNG